MAPGRGLRVGLTGGLGSGKTTVARMFAERGAHIISADELGRELMEPGTEVHAAIARQFGARVIAADGRLDRAALAHIAFAENRVEELNAIVHPATIKRQGEIADAIFEQTPGAIVIVESALIFETTFGDGWRERFDKLILVSAPESLKIERFIARSGGADREFHAAEARRRLSRMIPDEDKVAICDFVIVNKGSLAALEQEVDRVCIGLERAKSEVRSSPSL